MTVQTRNQLRVLIWTVLAGLILLTAPKAAEQLVFRPEFDAHLKQEGKKLDALLTLQCRESPDDTICRDYR